jgi:hypothetical protein
MAISPHYWEQGRREAPIHLQMALRQRPGPASSLAAGPVVRVFRDDTGQIRVGCVISFKVDWFDPDAARDTGPPVLGRQRIRVPLPWLGAARYLEVYLHAAAGGYEIAWEQVTPLERSTRTPMNPVDSSTYGILSPEQVRYPEASFWDRVRGWLGR